MPSDLLPPTPWQFTHPRPLVPTSVRPSTADAAENGGALSACGPSARVSAAGRNDHDFPAESRHTRGHPRPHVQVALEDDLFDGGGKQLGSNRSQLGRKPAFFTEIEVGGHAKELVLAGPGTPYVVARVACKAVQSGQDMNDLLPRSSGVAMTAGSLSALIAAVSACRCSGDKS